MVGRDGELALILKTKNGDLEAFGELVRTHQSLVVNFCYGMLANREDAEDLAQETFLRAFSAIKNYKPRAKFSTWLLTIAKNLTLNFLRNKRRRGERTEPRRWADGENDPIAALPATNPRPDEALLRKERAQWVHGAMQELSDTHQSIVILRDFEGMTYEEIANVMGCRKGTVKSRLSRAREQLREILLTRDVASEHGATAAQQGEAS